MTKRAVLRSGTDDQTTKRPKWRLRTLIEILPIIIALTVFFSYRTIQNGRPVDLVTPLTTVLGGVPLWVACLMALVASVGLLGMSWLIYIFSRTLVASDSKETD